MQFHWINSNEKYHEGAYRKWIAHGFGFTHGDSIYGRKLEVFQPGDLVFMYVDDMGIKTVGTVIKEWDGIEYHEPIIPSSGVNNEYRIEIKWFIVLDDFVSPKEVEEILGYPLIGTTARINKRDEREDLFQYILQKLG
jgi:hypothetical protein